MVFKALQSRWGRRALILGIWTFIGLFFASQAYMVLMSAQLAKADLPTQVPNPTWGELFWQCLIEWYIWGLLSFGIFWLARRFPFDGNRIWLVITVHLVASVFFSFFESALGVVVSEYIRQEIPKPTISFAVLKLYFIAKLHQNIIFYWAILFVGQAIIYYRKYRERELRTSRLEARLAEAQLQVLKMQLHPHFLFNTLNAISSLMHQNVELADRMLARLGDLLRTTLESANQQEVSLKQELDFIRPYLEIEQARIGARLSVHMDIEPAALDARVPNLILQPLVENAVRHGIAPRPGPGKIEISARREADRLRLQVHDDGAGLATTAKFKEGVGLSNTRARLQQLYGSNHSFELANGDGLTVRVTVPFRETAATGVELGGDA